MKMKIICERTGLSDRAVRHYIEEGLLSPAYTENYLGRRTFDFAEADVALLSEIATLRKFGFSVGEIRDMLHDSTSIRPTVEVLRARKERLIDAEETLLHRLSEVEIGEDCTVSELAAFLSRPVEGMEVPTDRNKRNVGDEHSGRLATFLLTLAAFLPIAFTFLGVFGALQSYRYSVLSPIGLFVALVALVPSFIFLLSRLLFKKVHTRILMQTISVVMCMLGFMLNFLTGSMIISHSSTEDLSHYRRIDIYCPLQNDRFYQNLFPLSVYSPSIGNESYSYTEEDCCYSYFYKEFLDYTYHIYAEWTLLPGYFSAEVARVEALYDAFDPNDSFENRFLEDEDYVIYRMRQGTYQCLVLAVCSEPEPFEAPENGDMFSYYIFAYDEESGRVRYIVDETQCAIGKPFYMTLSW